MTDVSMLMYCLLTVDTFNGCQVFLTIFWKSEGRRKYDFKMFGVCFSVVHLEHLTLNRMCQANLYKAMEV